MNWGKAEAYFGLIVGIIFISAGAILGSTGFEYEGTGDPNYCILGFFVFGIISICFGIYDYNRLENKERMQQQIQQIPQNPPHPQNPQRFCPKCGRQIPFDAVICPYCGHKF